ncbi:MAG: phosphoribosylaminoimidazolesuccinocarboxamide synthase [Gemmatimonadales bacterium]|nr:phosphoribosylaminoimidazolesuccinocarboxamide synthase [Gemmatimonadales bacterium]
MNVLTASRLPLPLWRKGKVREVYEVDDARLLLVASDRVSAFDVVMAEPVPMKGRVLTQLSAFWFQTLGHLGPHHFLTADTADIVAEVPRLAGCEEEIRGRAMLVRRTTPIAFECVVRGYLSGSAWQEYRRSGTLAGARLPPGLQESGRFPAPIFSPATKAESGHDENVTEATMAQALGIERTAALKARSLALFEAGGAHAERHGIIIADTKFEFGIDAGGAVVLIDEVLTPDSSRFWPADRYSPGSAQPSFDKQPLRDYLAGLRARGAWNGDAPPPPLPEEVISATSARYVEAYRRITGEEIASAPSGPRNDRGGSVS